MVCMWADSRKHDDIEFIVVYVWHAVWIVNRENPRRSRHLHLSRLAYLYHQYALVYTHQPSHLATAEPSQTLKPCTTWPWTTWIIPTTRITCTQPKDAEEIVNGELFPFDVNSSISILQQLCVVNLPIVVIMEMDDRILWSEQFAI